MAARYKYLNPVEALHTIGSILRQTNNWKAWVLLIIAILWSWMLNLSPIALGIYIAVQTHSFWPVVWVPIVVYIIYGLFLAFWPLLALFSFIGTWYEEGFLVALLATLFGIGLLVILFAGPEWLIVLASRYAEKAVRFGETSAAIGIDDAASWHEPEIIGLVGSSKSNKYHYPWCEWVQGLENKVWFLTPEEAQRQGYQPCKRCKPPCAGALK